MDPNLNSLLKWSIENSTPNTGENRATLPAGSSNEDNASTDLNDTTTSPPTQSRTQLDPKILSALLGGPSDADLMKSAMVAIVSPQVDLEQKLTAFDNFEQLIENLDNANNIGALGLWGPLTDQLGSEEGEIRVMAAWCIGTSVQNNTKAQDAFLATSALPTITRLSYLDPDLAVRKKCVYALSSAVRNYQPGLDEALKYLPDDIVSAEDKEKGLSAADMEAVDKIMEGLRAKITAAKSS